MDPPSSPDPSWTAVNGDFEELETRVTPQGGSSNEDKFDLLLRKINNLEQEMSTMRDGFGDGAREFFADHMKKKEKERQDYAKKCRSFDQNWELALDKFEETPEKYLKYRRTWYINKLFLILFIGTVLFHFILHSIPWILLILAIAAELSFVILAVDVKNIEKKLSGFNSVSRLLEKPNPNYQPSNKKILVERGTELLKKIDMFKRRYAVIDIIINIIMFIVSFILIPLFPQSFYLLVKIDKLKGNIESARNNISLLRRNLNAWN